MNGAIFLESYTSDSLVMGTINLQKKYIVFPGLVLDQLDHSGRPVPWLGRAHLQLPNRSLPFTPTSYSLFWAIIWYAPLRCPSNFTGLDLIAGSYVLLNVRALEFYLTGGSALVWTLDASVWETHAGFLIFCVTVYSQYFFFIYIVTSRWPVSLTRSCLANVTVTTAPISACRVLLDMSHWRPHDRQSVIKLH